jgi:hypothetical protein
LRTSGPRRQHFTAALSAASPGQPPPGGNALTAEDRRGLTPLFWTHVAPYGEVERNMTRRLELRGETHQRRQP